MLLTNFLSKIKIKDYGYPLTRFGEKNDGGYLLPEHILNNLKYILSAGVGDTIQFEKDLKNKFNIKPFFIDDTVDLDKNMYHFTRKRINSFNDDFNITLNTWIENIKKQNNINFSQSILSIDIEGFEIEGLLSLQDKNLSQFAIIVCEFHNFSQIKNISGLKLYKVIFDKILTHFEVCHIHPNNVSPCIRIKNISIPPIMEFTFLNKRYCSKKNTVNNRKYPLKEDAKSVLRKRDINLPKILIS